MSEKNSLTTKAIPWKIESLEINIDSSYITPTMIHLNLTQRNIIKSYAHRSSPIKPSLLDRSRMPSPTRHESHSFISDHSPINHSIVPLSHSTSADVKRSRLVAFTWRNKELRSHCFGSPPHEVSGTRPDSPYPIYPPFAQESMYVCTKRAWRKPRFKGTNLRSRRCTVCKGPITNDFRFLDNRMIRTLSTNHCF